MCDDETKELLQNILYSLETEKYEPGGIFTIGGGNGTYAVKSPWNTECEFCIVAVTTSVGTGAPYTISSSNSLASAPTTSTSLGAVSTGGEGNVFEGISGYASTGSVSNMIGYWLPLGRGAYVYLNCTPGASNVLFANIAFRRVYTHLIAFTPAQSPATYNRPTSRRGIRAVEHFSKQVSGFVAQYPEREGGKETYTHVEIPFSQNTRGAYRPGRTRHQQ
jgi:hypothetical protein